MEEIDKTLKLIKPYVLGWIASYLQSYLAGGLSVRSLNLGTESGADLGDIRISGTIRRSTATAVRAHRSSDVNTTHNQWYCIPFNATPRFEQPADLDLWSSPAPTRLYARLSGIYLVHLQVKFAPNVTGQRALMVRRNANGAYNGGTEVAGIDIQAIDNATWNTDLLLTTLTSLNAGDYLEAFAFQNSGGALTLVHADEGAPEFMFCKIA